MMESDSGRTLRDRVEKMDDPDENVSGDEGVNKDELNDIVDRGMEWCHEFVTEQKKVIRYSLWLPLAFLYFIYALYWCNKTLIITSWNLANGMGRSANEDRKKRKFKTTRALQACAIPVAWLAGFTIPTITAILLIAIPCVFVDQSFTVYKPIPAEFTDPNNQELHDGQKVALQFKASHHRVEEEFNTFFGWTANDPWFYLPQTLFDNPKNYQSGLAHGALEMAVTLSDRVTRMGDGKPEHPLAIKYRKKLAIGPDHWEMWVTDTEGVFAEGIEASKKFEELAAQDASIVDVRKDDLAAILKHIRTKVLGQSRGNLTEDPKNVSWFKVDDIVKDARGTAIIARDELAVMRSCYAIEMASGGLNNLDIAIESLDAVVRQPIWYAVSSRFNMLPNHRGALLIYYTEAIERIKDIERSLAPKT